MAPNPLWVEVEANSITGTWQAVSHEYGNTDKNSFARFKSNDGLVYLLSIKLMLDACLCAELYYFDVVSQIPLVLATLVWMFPVGYVLFSRQVFFQSQIPVENTDLHPKWPVSVVMTLFVDVGINLIWALMF